DRFYHDVCIRNQPYWVGMGGCCMGSKGRRGITKMVFWRKLRGSVYFHLSLSFFLHLFLFLSLLLSLSPPFPFHSPLPSYSIPILHLLFPPFFIITIC